MLNVVYVRGGCKRAPEVAKQAGMLYGIRHDYTPYGDVYMLDVAWKRLKSNPGEWDKYVRIADRLRPQQAMVQDFEIDMPVNVLYKQVEDMRRIGIPQIMVCPKRSDWQQWLPAGVIIAISVPARDYAGYPIEPSLLAHRDVHLLGGSVQSQVKWIASVNGAGGKVVSVDNSHWARKAALGQMWDGNKFVVARGSTPEIEISSGKTVVKTLQHAAIYAQPMLFAP